MTYSWLMAPHEYEPDYDAYFRELELLEEAMANVATYDDWFPGQCAAEPRCVNAHDRCYGGAGGPCTYCETTPA